MKLKHFEKFQDTTEALAGTVWWSFAHQLNELEPWHVYPVFYYYISGQQPMGVYVLLCCPWCISEVWMRPDATQEFIRHYHWDNHSLEDINFLVLVADQNIARRGMALVKMLPAGSCSQQCTLGLKPFVLPYNLIYNFCALNPEGIAEHIAMCSDWLSLQIDLLTF